MNCINHPERPRIAFCQNCGKPLCAECARVVGSAVFDEPCLVERLSAANAAAAAAGGPGAYSGAYGAGSTASTPYEPMPGGGTRYTVNGTAEGVPYGRQGGTPLAGAPNPGLALLLGFIPGVGAMYNSQYAKGIVHLTVFAVLVSLSDHYGFFGLLLTGWVFYQAIEAYHTAKARRDGTPLPNPFGLNDIGERLGFGRAWGAAPGTAGTAPVGPPPPPPETPGGGFSQADSPGAATTQGAAAYTPYTAPAASPYAGYAPVPGVPPASGPGAAGATWGPTAGYGAMPGTVGAGLYADRRSRFPVGALVLIGLGLLFLIGNAGWIEGFPIYRLMPFLLIGLGVWIFTRRMLDTGTGLADDGSPAYRLRVYRALRGSIWVILVGVLFLLDSYNILSWSRSWPLFIVVGGLVAFLERSAFASAAQMTYSAAPSATDAPVAAATVPPAASPEVSTPSAAAAADPARHPGEV